MKIVLIDVFIYFYIVLYLAMAPHWICLAFGFLNSVLNELQFPSTCNLGWTLIVHEVLAEYIDIRINLRWLWPVSLKYLWLKYGIYCCFITTNPVCIFPQCSIWLINYNKKIYLIWTTNISLIKLSEPMMTMFCSVVWHY